MTQSAKTTRNHLLTDEEMRDLFHEAGPRPALADEDLARIRVAAHHEWKRVVDQRPAAQRPTWLPRALALAATLVLALLASWWWSQAGPTTSAETVAIVEVVAGEAWMQRDPDSRRSQRVQLETGESLHVGTEIQTGVATAVSGAALRLESGHVVRLDKGTRLRLTSRSRLELSAGAVYVDSGPQAARYGALEIDTALGTIREVGTRYEVRLDGTNGSALRVRVREGEVVVESADETHSARRGEELEFHADGSMSRGSIEPFGESWAWVLETSPGIEIEGLALAEFLDWLGRETGWTIEYADDDLRQTAVGIVLHGTIEGLRPDLAAEQVVLPSSGLGHRLDEDGTLVVIRQ